jgi:hypothetical protein
VVDAGRRRIGDADAPSTIAAAVYSRHKIARERDLTDTDQSVAKSPILRPNTDDRAGLAAHDD